MVTLINVDATTASAAVTNELTGARPGHSYTVKSPPTSSSSDVISGSRAFGSALWLWGEEGGRGEG